VTRAGTGQIRFAPRTHHHQLRAGAPEDRLREIGGDGSGKMNRLQRSPALRKSDESGSPSVGRSCALPSNCDIKQPISLTTDCITQSEPRGWAVKKRKWYG